MTAILFYALPGAWAAPDDSCAVRGAEEATTQAVSVELPLLGERIKLTKYWDDTACSWEETAVNARGEAVDYASLRLKESALWQETYGAMTPQMVDALKALKGEEEVAVYLQARTGTMPTISDYLEDEESAVEAARAQVVAAVKALTEVVESYGGEVVDYVDEAPFVEVVVPLDRLLDLSHEFDVARVLPRSTVNIDTRTQALSSRISCSYPYEWWKDAIEQPKDRTGDGVRIALVAPGEPHALLATRNTPIYRYASSLGQFWETTGSAAVLVEDDSVVGVAPDAQLMVASSSPTNDIFGAEWAWKNNADVILAPTWVKRETGDRHLEDLYFDWLGNNAPFPVIVRDAGHSGQYEYDHAELTGLPALSSYSYNSLAVGGSTQYSGIWSESSWLNPTSPHGDRELPELVAPAVDIDTSLICDINGTHVAAAMVAGAAASVIEAQPALRPWPEAVRAALLAGAHENKDGDAVSNGFHSLSDQKDGVGALSIRHATTAATHDLLTTATNIPWGVGYGLLNKRQLQDNHIVSYRLETAYPSEDRTARVALAWSHSVDCEYGEDELPEYDDIRGCGMEPLSADLDLFVYDITTYPFELVGYSMSHDNNYEVVEFTMHPDRRYRIDVDPHTPGTFGDGDTKYGISIVTH